jgi:cysteinyl-tRNA synthetase
MAKSEDNFITLRTLIEKGFSPLAYRYFLLQSHYRTPTNFSWEAIQAAQNAYRKLKDTLSNLPLDGTADKKYMNEFAVAIENDLNTSEALAVVWKLLKDETIVDADKRATLLNFDRVLGLKLDDNEFAITNIPEEIQKLLNNRAEARLNKDFQKSDELREKIRTLGYEVEDKESGQTLKKI